MCKLILIRSFMYTDSSRGLVFFSFHFQKRVLCVASMERGKSPSIHVQQFSFCCDVWIWARMCLCVCLSLCKSWFKTHICVADVSRAMPPRAGWYVRTYESRFIEIWAQIIYTYTHSIYEFILLALAHISKPNRTKPTGKKTRAEAEKKLFPI